MRLFNLFTFLLLSGFILLSSCGDNNCIKENNEIITETLDVKPFTNIILAGTANVVISQGETQEVKVTGSSNIIRSIKTEVSDSTWVIDLYKGCYNYKELIFDITIPKISNVIVNGTGNIKINNFNENGDLSIGLHGTGTFELHSFTGMNNLNIRIDGTGDINALENTTSIQNINIDINGTGNVRLFPFITNKNMINISGTGNCEVHVIEDLKIYISGTGNIYYKGHPNIEQNISGTGNIYDKND